MFFLGANEGFPFEAAGGKSIDCCGPAWAAQYATRARRMMETFRQDAAARVYWLTLPMPRGAARQKIARSVNAAIVAAAQPFRAQVRVLDMSAVFTPGGAYRAAMPVGGRSTIVREPDGIHLNEAGAALAADIVIARLKADFASRALTRGRRPSVASRRSGVLLVDVRDARAAASAGHVAGELRRDHLRRRDGGRCTSSRRTLVVQRPFCPSSGGRCGTPCVTLMPLAQLVPVTLSCVT